MDLLKLSIRKIKKMLLKKEIDVKTLIHSVINAIDEDNKRDDKINAYVEIFASDALKQAEEAQKKIGSGEDSPLLGIPIAIKDNLCYEGHLMTSGSQMLSGYYATYNATTVERLINAGAIIVGRTNMDEFAMGSTTETSKYGVTRNPINRKYVPGGSSGGSAAAVSGGFAFGALGSDTGGSIRQPASFCGVVGVKPTYGRVPRLGCVAMASSLDQVGPIARDVYDAALITKVIAGFSDRETTTIDIEVPEYEKNLERDVKDFTIGIPKEYFSSDLIDSDVRRNIELAIKTLEKNGAKIVDISLPHCSYGPMVYYSVMSVEVASNLGRFDGIRYGYHPEGNLSLDDYYKEARSSSFDFEAKARILFGTLLASSEYYKSHYEYALKVKRLIQMDFENAFEKVSAIISPTSPITAGLLGERNKTDSSLNFLADSYVSNINLAGLPSISVPCGNTSNGLPIGLQIITNKFDETTMFSLAYSHEKLFKN